MAIYTQLRSIAAIGGMLCLLMLPALPPAGADPAALQPAKETAPDNSGPVQVVSASWLGGDFNDDLVGSGIGADGSVILAGNTVTLTFNGVQPLVFGPPGTLQDVQPPAPPPPDASGKKRSNPADNWVHPSTFGFVVRLSSDGQKVLSCSRFGYGAATVRNMKLDPRGNIYLLGNAPAGLSIAGAQGQGDFIARLSPDASQLQMLLFHPQTRDFGVDSNGDLVVLSGHTLTRYSAEGKQQKWTATWSSHGDNRPGAIAVSPRTGVTAVVGYGMTGTGHEPWKDPYAYGFDRDGKQIWELWNEDPAKEAADKYGGNGLMADTTGNGAGVDADGNFYLMLFADGGNTVVGIDPHDPFKKIDPNVYAGVFQATAGYGFHGANKTSVVLRVNPLTGELEKGTFMSAWLGWPTRDHANGLGIDAATGTRAIKTTDGHETGLTFLAGNSAYGFPAVHSWYQAPEGGYRGGGYLSVLDRDFKMIQSGYFPGASIHSVAYRDGLVVIAGQAGQENTAKPPTDPNASEVTYPVPIYHPIQNHFGGGAHDGYFVILRVDPGMIRRLEAGQPAAPAQ